MKAGFGLMTIYVDGMYSPILTMSLNLDNCPTSRALGDKECQTSVLSWQFSSLYIDNNSTLHKHCRLYYCHFRITDTHSPLLCS